jgi:hypothetical protein
MPGSAELNRSSALLVQPLLYCCPKWPCHIIPYHPHAMPCHQTTQSCATRPPPSQRDTESPLSQCLAVSPRKRGFALLDSQEYPLAAWPARLVPCGAGSSSTMLCKQASSRPRLGIFQSFHGHDACRKEHVSRPPSQSHNYKAAKDQCNPMNPLPRCRTMKAFNPSSSGYHAADPSVSQQ